MTAFRTSLQHGFTLIEVLVVTAIMAVILGLTVVRLQSSDASKVKLEAEKLSLALEKARDMATISGRNVAFSSDGSGYQFWLSDAAQDEWKTVVEEGLRAQVLPDGLNLTYLKVNGGERPLGERVVFAPDGGADTFELTVQAGEARIALFVDVMGRIELRNVDK